MIIPAVHNPIRLFHQTLRDYNGLLTRAVEMAAVIWPMWDFTLDANLQCTMRSGNSIVTMVLDPGGDFVRAKWWMKSLWDKDGHTLSEDRLYDENDIIGWLGMVKTDMVNAAVKRLVALFDGPNIFPAGEPQAVKNFIASAFVINDFQLEVFPTMERIFTLLKPRYDPLWRTKPGEDPQKWVLDLEGVGKGAMVAKREANVIKWRIMVPIRYDYVKNSIAQHTIDQSGEMTIGSEIDDDRIWTSDAAYTVKDWLLWKFLEVVLCGYLAKKMPPGQLPTSWTL